MVFLWNIFTGIYHHRKCWGTCVNISQKLKSIVYQRNLHFTLIYIANHLPWRRQCNRLLSFKLSLFASLASFNAPFKYSLTCVSSWRCLNFDMFSVPTKGFKSHFFTQHLVKHPIKALKKTTWTFSSPLPVIQTDVLVSGLSSIMAGHGGKSNNSAHLIEPTIISDATVDLLEASGSSGASQP